MAAGERETPGVDASRCPNAGIARMTTWFVSTGAAAQDDELVIEALAGLQHRVAKETACVVFCR